MYFPMILKSKNNNFVHFNCIIIKNKQISCCYQSTNHEGLLPVQIVVKGNKPPSKITQNPFLVPLSTFSSSNICIHFRYQTIRNGAPLPKFLAHFKLTITALDLFSLSGDCRHQFICVLCFIIIRIVILTHQNYHYHCS